MENTAALKKTEYGLERQKPKTIAEIGKELSKETDFDVETASLAVAALLVRIAEENQQQLEKKERYTCLPFKLHQFFAQTGSVYAHLGVPGERAVTLEPNVRHLDDYVFPHVFSRASGSSFICVHTDRESGTLLPREFQDTDSRDGNDFGYIHS